MTPCSSRSWAACAEDTRHHPPLAPDILRRLQAILPSERRFLVGEARCDGHFLGAVLVGFYGDNAEYLGSTVNGEGRQRGAEQLLLW